MTKLFWFQRDLRLQDNPGLASCAGSGRLLLVYFWPEHRPWCNVTGMGQQRRRFLLESLAALRTQLAPLGQDLLVLRGRPEIELPLLVKRYRVQTLVTTVAPGFFERRTRERVAEALDIPMQLALGTTLYAEDELPFDAAAMPAQFTPFRRQLEEQVPAAPIPAPAQLPPPPDADFAAVQKSDCNPHIAFPVRGGSDAGRRRLQQWIFSERAILEYKNTRNGLEALSGSSCLSPWLATGALSVREVAAAISRLEEQAGANESTRWLLYEILWREFFQWRALVDDVGLFRPGGCRGKVHRCTFEPRNFARWCAGDTNFPLVNALMHQLVETGWMSNRGRQIVASCLVNELGIDWRYGAAFFEKHLLDFDVASNYGNWQYIAGVGADPRGGRHFNLARQAAQYDPDGSFTTRWDGLRPRQPDYVVDAADWPLS